MLLKSGCRHASSVVAIALTFELMFLHAPTAEGQPVGGTPPPPTLGGRYAIQTIRGNYLTAVNGGGIAGRPAIHTDATRVSTWETFTLVPLNDGTYAIQTMTGNYLTALNGGGVAGRVAIHTDARVVKAWEKFAFVDLRDGTYAISTINGRYLNALNGGGIGSGRIAVHTDATRVDAWERFRLVRLDMAQPPPPPTGGMQGFSPWQNGMDLFEAGDYRSVALPRPQPDLCLAECARDARCRSVTYTQPGTYGNPFAACWLKERTGRLGPHAAAMSAVKGGLAGMPPPTVTPPPPVATPPELPPVYPPVPPVAAPPPQTPPTVSCTVNIQRTWYSATPGDSSGYHFYVLSPDTWASRDIGYGDATTRQWWGAYRCSGINTWEFRNANGGLFKILTLRSDGRLYYDQKGEIYRP